MFEWHEFEQVYMLGTKRFIAPACGFGVHAVVAFDALNEVKLVDQAAQAFPGFMVFV